MTKKKIERAAAVAQYLATAADAVGQVRLPGKVPGYGPNDHALITEQSYWDADRTDKTSFRARVWYTDRDDEPGRLFEVTVKEVKDV